MAGLSLLAALCTDLRDNSTTRCRLCLETRPLCVAYACSHASICWECAQSERICQVCGTYAKVWTGTATPPHVMCHMLSGKMFRLELKGAVTVNDLLWRIQDAQGIPTQYLRLVFNRTMLNKDDVLVSIGIYPGALIYVVAKLRGD